MEFERAVECRGKESRETGNLDLEKVLALADKKIVGLIEGEK